MRCRGSKTSLGLRLVTLGVRGEPGVVGVHSLLTPEPTPKVPESASWRSGWRRRAGGAPESGGGKAP